MASSSDAISELSVEGRVALEVADSPRRRLAGDLSVGSKLAISALVIAMAVIVVIANTLYAIERYSNAGETATAAADQVEAATWVGASSAELRASQLAYVGSTSTERRAEFEGAAHRFDQALDELRQRVDDPIDVALVRRISTSHATFRDLDQLIWDKILNGDDIAAENLARGPEALAFAAIAADAENLVLRARDVEAEAMYAFDEAESSARTIAILIAIAALSIVAATTWLVARSVRIPLQAVQRAAEEAAEGELSVAVQISGADEIGRLARAFNTMMERLRVREQTLLAEHERQRLARQIQAALELAESSEEALDSASRALEQVAADMPGEILLSDNSEAHLEQMAVSGPVPGGPGCTVIAPYSCPAVRAGRAITYESSEHLDACPHLRGRDTGACSATCAPVSFMGRAMGVVHVIGPEGEPPDLKTTEAIVTVAGHTGARIGVLRSMAQTQLQATTDGLTGLINRRAFESRAGALHRSGERFVVVMADLDHFKMLNDTYGHEGGDRALRLFTDVLGDTTRSGDLVCRWGGEEFALALLGADTNSAGEMLDRIRVELSGRVATSQLPPFTASYGYVEAGLCDSLEEAVRRADQALYVAKADGRDRAIPADLSDPLPEMSNWQPEVASEVGPESAPIA